MLHPRRCGVAAHFGVVADVPTIGITKTHLAGSFDNKHMTAGELREVRGDGELLGFAIRPRASSKRLIYASPGQRVETAIVGELVLRMLQGRASPEPIYWADRLSRKAIAR